MVAAGVRSHPNPRHSRHAILHGAGTGNRLARRHCFGGCVQSRRDSLPSAYGSSALCGRDTDGSAAPRREGITEASPPDESTGSARLGDDLSEMSGERTGHALCLVRRVGRRFGTLAQASANPGEAKILEGSVQKAADQVRVNVQLINAQTDSHLWAETYDRKLTDVLGVESEIAKSVAESLQARLNGREEHALAVKPTKNPEAYDAYLRGLAFEARSYRYTYPDLWRKAVDYYQRAAQLDPNFASAWSRLSRLNAHLYFSHSVETNSAARGDAAKLALENAQKLAPDSSETLLALGYYQYWVLRDYPAAKTTFARVSKLWPSSSEVTLALALIAEREGHWDESVDNFERALSLDPRNVELLNQAAGIYDMLRQFPAALKLFNRAWDITPNDPDAA